MQPKLSQTGKMPCQSFSLPAVRTCPGAHSKDGGLVAACRGCYATDGRYQMPNVQAPRRHNLEAWRNDHFADHMVDMLDNSRWFRWFDSGDIYHPELARKVHEVCVRTPWINHWLPTRSHKVAKLRPLIANTARLRNVTVRFSSDSIIGETIPGASHQSTIVPEDYDGNFHVCPAPDQKGKCLKCRACWDKDVPVIAYRQHGRKMAKVAKEVHLIAKV